MEGGVFIMNEMTKKISSSHPKVSESTPVFSKDHSNIEKVTQGNTQFAINLYKKIIIKVM